MFNFQRIFSKLLETPTARFVSGYCVRARNQKHNCRICLDNCPGKAIVMDGHVHFIEDQCLGCGVCAATCPTGAFVLERPSRRQLLEQLQGQRVVNISCHKGDKVPGMLEISCLGYLDSQVLVAIALQGTKVYLDLAGERCSTCGGKGASLALAELKKAERILHALDEEENVGSAGSVTEAEVKLLSRDEFLGFCRRKIGTEFKKNVTLLLEFQENTSPGQKSGKGANGEVARNIALPEQRRLMLESLAKKEYQRGEKLVEVDSLPFGGVKIADNCTVCGDCTVFCPTGALKKSVQEGNVAITHRPAQCLKCGLCALGCRVKALEYLQTFDLEQVLSGEEINVFQLTVKHCTECDAEITLQSESGLCYSCQTNKEIESDLDKVFANELR